MKEGRIPTMKPPKDKSFVKTNSISVRFTTEELEFVKTNAHKIDIPLAQYIRAKVLWYHMQPRGQVVHSREKLTYRKSGDRKGEPYYYETAHTGIVKEHSMQVAQKLEDEYQQRLSNTNSHNKLMNPITIPRPHSYQDEIDEESEIIEYNTCYLNDLLHKGDLHMGDKFYRENEGEGRIIRRYSQVGPVVTDLSYFDRFTKRRRS
jgi:hypothetical protein